MLPKNTVCALAVGQWCKPAHLLLHYCRIPLSLSFSLSFSGGEGDICLSFPDIPPPAKQQGCPHHFFPFLFCFEKKVYPFKGRSNKSKEQTFLFFFFILEKTQCNIQFTSICLKSILRIFTSSWQNIFPVFPLFSVYNNTVSRSFYFIILACNC